MDFLGVGVPELIVVIILALIFIGPRDLPRMAGRFAKFLRDLRMMSEGFTTEWRREIAAASRIEGLKELKEELEATRDTLREAGQEIRNGMRITQDDLEPETADQTNSQAKQVAAAEETEQTIHPPGTAPAGTNHRAPTSVDAPVAEPDSATDTATSPVTDTTAQDETPPAAADAAPTVDEPSNHTPAVAASSTQDETPPVAADSAPTVDEPSNHTPAVAASSTESAADKEEIPNRG